MRPTTNNSRSDNVQCQLGNHSTSNQHQHTIPRRYFRWENGWEQPYAPDPVISPPYSYGTNTSSYADDLKSYEDVFSMDGVAQATPRELELFLEGKSKEKGPKKWLTTQLHLFGIPFKKSATIPEVKETLDRALDEGKCHELAPPIAAVRDRLREQYDEACKQLEDKMFAEIEGGYAEEANADPPRFVAKYFLDSDGRPDREKTKDPLSFHSWNNRQELVDRVNAVPGLAIIQTKSTAIVGWETEMDRGIENEFARLELFFAGHREKIHSHQANVSSKRFLKKHLGIDDDWSAPAQDKRPSAAVTLSRWYLDDRDVPKQILEKTPGLQTEVFEDNHVIGWDAAHVAAEVARLKEERRRLVEQEEAEARAAEEKKARIKARWERRCKGYYKLVQLAKTRESRRPLDLQHLPGLYLVRWDDDSADAERYNDPSSDSDVMKLNIFPAKSSHGCKAYFNFGPIEGTMLLAMTKRGVEMLRDEQPKHSEWSDGEVSDYEDHDGNAGSKVEAGFNLKITGEKRSLGDIADPWGVQAARAKRQQLMHVKKEEEESHPNRVYFQFVCNELDGYPLVDDDNEHVGYLDFDETGLAAKGNFDVPRLGMKEQVIAIFKVAEKPASDNEPLPWYMFDGRKWGSTW